MQMETWFSARSISPQIILFTGISVDNSIGLGRMKLAEGREEEHFCSEAVLQMQVG